MRRHQGRSSTLPRASYCAFRALTGRWRRKDHQPWRRRVLGSLDDQSLCESSARSEDRALYRPSSGRRWQLSRRLVWLSGRYVFARTQVSRDSLLLGLIVPLVMKEGSGTTRKKLFLDISRRIPLFGVALVGWDHIGYARCSSKRKPTA